MTVVLDPADIIECRFWCQMDEQASVTTLHYRVLATVNNPTDQMVADLIDAQIGSLFPPLMSNEARYLGVQVQKIAPAPRNIAVQSTTAASNGTVASDPLPRQVTGLITKLSNLAGAAGRGRSYIPFPPESENDPDTGVPSADYMTDLVTLAAEMDDPQTFTSGVNSVDLVPIIWSAEDFTFVDITTCVAKPNWATQRRRGFYGSPNTPPI